VLVPRTVREENSHDKQRRGTARAAPVPSFREDAEQPEEFQSGAEKLIKGVKQLPGEEQPGNMDPSAGRSIGTYQEIFKKSHMAGPCCAQYRKLLPAHCPSAWQGRIQHLHNPEGHAERR